MRALTPETLFDLPLDGVCLVEASAGSGKTYMLAALVLRLVLEGTGIEQVLAVTFTNAATDELRGRIRERLRTCLRILETDEGGDDPVLAAVRARHGHEPGPAIERLQAALAAMDEAPIHTIHAFCLKVLREHTFAVGVDYDLEVLEDDGELVTAAFRDHWRARVGTLPPRLLALAHARWPRGAADLEALLRPYLAREVAVRTADPRGTAELQAALERLAEQVRGEAVARDPEALEELLGRIGRVVRAEGPYKAGGWQARSATALAAWLACEGTWPPALSAVALRAAQRKRLDAAGAAEADALAAHPLLELGDEVLALERAWPQAFVREALPELRRRVGRRRAELGALAHDDLLARVRTALEGPRGETLAAALAGRWPVALVDEFQDTDPMQYTIFRRLAAAGQRQVLIGDPKQAIYAFRGADVFTYMGAHRSIPPARRYGLPYNWRAAAPAVDAVNAVFGRDEAFLYPEIAFHPAQVPPGRALPEAALPDGEGAGLCIWRLPTKHDGKGKPGPWSLEEGREMAAAATARHVAGLLAAAARGEARIGTRALRPSDLAVLVFTHRQARAVREALARRGIASAYVSGESVWESEEAAELGLLLAAMASPTDAALVRRALASPLLGWGIEALARELDDPARWESWLDAFADMRLAWERHGFMAAFYALLRRLDLPRRLRAQPGGERRLTNLLQLGELTQAAAQHHHGIEDLLVWYARARAGAERSAEAAELRLESDEALVRILTVHRAKGLEFPVVYVPFPWECGGTRPAKVGNPRRGRTEPEPVVWHDDAGAVVLDLDAGRKGRARRELLAEQARLLYVALTRAVHRTYLSWGCVGWPSGSPDSPFAWLVHARGVRPDEVEADAGCHFLSRGADQAIDRDLDALAARSGGAVRILPWPDGETAERPGPPRGEAPRSRGPEAAQSGDGAVQARPFRGAIRDDWRVASYSLLVGRGHATADRDALAAAEAEPPAVDSVHALPRGARLGNLMHALLERADLPALAAGHEGGLQALVERLAPRHGIARELAPAIVVWLGRILRTPLPCGVTLGAIPAEARLAELPFHFRAERLDLEALDALLRANGLAPLPEERPFGRMRGLLSGQIDLVFRHEGRWYLADHKTTWLGPDADAYVPERLAEAMRAHRYDLQYLIYLVALHRYLARRVPDYRYEDHMGGVLYLFLRGMDGTPGRGVHFVRPPRALVEGMEAVLEGRAHVP